MRNKLNRVAKLNGKVPARENQEGGIFMIDYDVPQRDGTFKDIYHVAFGKQSEIVDESMFDFVAEIVK